MTRHRANGERNGADRSEEYRQVAVDAGLRYVSDGEPGYRRKGNGRGFHYVSESGRKLTDEGKLTRIVELTIPPAWTDVWICRFANGHLQATGRDDRQRKQYLYHPQWHEAVGRRKFDRLLEVGELLPKIRRRVLADLRKRNFSRTKTIALVVRLLDVTALRVGNAEYARDNESYGLTTLENRHVQITGNRIRFSFVGKSGKEQRLDVIDRSLSRLLRRYRQLPGKHLFQYREEGELIPVSSEDVNEYLNELTEGRVTAKDFRTWRASVMAAAELYCGEPPESESKRKRALNVAIRSAASRLGNTLTVCRKYYVHTGLGEAYLQGRSVAVVCGFKARRRKWHLPDEQLLLHVLENLTDDEAPPDASRVRSATSGSRRSVRRTAGRATSG
jgi:DNA topoisomerase-1